MPNLEIFITAGEVSSSIDKAENETKITTSFPTHISGENLSVSPIDIWSALIASTKQTLKAADLKATEVDSLRIVCHFDISVFWDDETLGTVRDAIGSSDSHVKRVEQALETDPQLSGTLAANRLVTGTLPEYLVSRMTRGLHTVIGEIEIKTDATAFCGIAAKIIA